MKGNIKNDFEIKNLSPLNVIGCNITWWALKSQSILFLFLCYFFYSPKIPMQIISYCHYSIIYHVSWHIWAPTPPFWQGILRKKCHLLNITGISSLFLISWRWKLISLCAFITNLSFNILQEVVGVDVKWQQI